LEPGDLKQMKLYQNPDRVFGSLRHVGIDPDGPLTVADLAAFDQYHYFGAEAVREAIDTLALSADHHVLDVGAGLGGPARMMAQEAGSSVTAIELQTDLFEISQLLTEKCGLTGRVTHLNGDVLEQDFSKHGFDAAVSWLVFLHIADREKLFTVLHDALKPCGRFYFEDYYARGVLTDAEKETLAKDVYCHYLPTLDRYVADLEQAGFVDIETVDMTPAWIPFVRTRRDDFKAKLDANAEAMGPETAQAQAAFFDTVAGLFDGGNLGGVRLTGRKP